MKILLRQCKIVDPQSPHNGKLKDVFIENGIIKKIADKIDGEKADKIIDQKNIHVSPGWFDMRANFCEPGFEYKEDLLSGCKAAAAGGFTGVMVMPSTNPPLSSKSEIEFIKSKTSGNIVDVHIAGTLSAQLNGSDLSEMYDMHTAGALAFTDDKIPVHNSGLMLRALLYAKNFGGLIISFAEDENIGLHGKMNEGISSTMLGLKGIPALAEDLMIARDLSLTEYAEGKIHFATLSSARAVELVRQAKAKGLKVTAEVSAHQLYFTDAALETFDTNLKVKPPLRAQEDVDALKKGLADGTIDAICSDHAPEDVENKVREFDHAAFGMLGLQTCFAVANTSLQNILSTQQLIEKISIAPRKILGLKIPSVKEGEAANLTIFNPSLEWTFNEQDILSKSRNTPFVGKAFVGKALGVINGDKVEMIS